MQRLTALAAVFLLLCVFVPGRITQAAAPEENDPARQPLQVELFQAVADGQVQATFIPRHSRRASIQLENKTDRPLTVVLPRALGARPVLAQWGPGFQQQNPQQLPFGQDPFNNNQNQQGPQALGVAMNMPGMNGQNPMQGLPFMQIPPGKRVAKRIDCVCLQQGLPEPNARVPYEIVPLAEVAPEPEVRELVEKLASGGYDQETVQIAVWHFTDDISWENLVEMRRRFANGTSQPYFPAGQVQRAAELVERLPSQQQKKAEEESSSRR